MRSTIGEPQSISAALRAEATLAGGRDGTVGMHSDLPIHVTMHRPRFSLLLLLLITTYVSAGLGLQRYVSQQRPNPIDVAALLTGLAALSGFMYWLVTSSTRRFRVFVLATMLGAAIEVELICFWHARNWVAYSTDPWLPSGWFPTSLPVERALYALNVVDFHTSAHRSIAVGMLITGLACGLLALAAVRLFERRDVSITAARGAP